MATQNHLTSDQVNYLIWRYLQECGYTYSIYAFQHETKAETYHEQYGPKIKPGSLIHLVQRGLLYRELQLQINKDGTKKEPTEEVEPFFPPAPKDLKHVGSTGVGNGNMEVDDEEEDDERTSVATAIQQPPSVTNSRKHGRGEEGPNGISSGGEKTGVPDKKKRKKTGSPPTPVAPTTADKPDVDGDRAMVGSLSGQSPQVEEIRPITNGCSIGVQVEAPTDINTAETVLLTNEEQKENILAYSPVESGKLVMGGPGSVARLWSIAEGSGSQSHILLDHSSNLIEKQEVTAVQWSNDGTLLATATADGTTKLWNSLGLPSVVLPGRTCSILQLWWNNTASILLTLSMDDRLLAWDVCIGGVPQSLEGKQAERQVLDVAWIGEETFAAAGTDGDIVIYAAKTGGIKKTFKGEEGVVMVSLAWDEFGERLASGDTKGRITIWGYPSTTPEFTFQAHGHGSSVPQLLWQPMRSSQSIVSELSSRTRILASRSDADPVVKLWSINSSSTTPPPFIELRHNSGVGSMSFSPDGKYIAAASNTGLYIWRVEDGSLAYVYQTVKQENAILTNGDTHQLSAPQTNGDVEMGGMDDFEVDRKIDSGKIAPASPLITDISWDVGGTVVAIAITGTGCVLLPLKPKPQTAQNHFPPPLPAGTSENGSTVERTTSPATVETAITPPSIINGTYVEEQANGSINKQTVR